MDPMDAPKPKKFFFDLNDFDEEAMARKRIELMNLPPTFSVEQIETARDESRALGREEGRAEAMQTIERQTADSLQALVQTAERLSKAEEQRLLKMTEQATALTYQVLSRLLPELLAGFGAAQIVTFIRETVRANLKAGSLTINLHPDQKERVWEKLSALSDAYPFLSDLTLKGEAGLNPNECRVAWTQGGADWDPDRIAQEMLEVFKTHLPDALVNSPKTTHTDTE